MSEHFQRAMLLAAQDRHQQALEEFQLELAHDPQNPVVHPLMALSLVDLERFDEAEDQARQGVHLKPDRAFAHYALARVLFARRRYAESRGALDEAIQLDPEEADYHALSSNLHFAASRWTEALAAAQQGLSIDPEHEGCTNLRAMSLVKLGRRAEAGQTIDAALARNPDNATTHANMGWTLLEQGQPRQALEHFREALRLEPDSEWARHGIVEALKARNIIYRGMLAWFLWMAKLSPRTQWAVVIGGYFGIRLLNQAAAANPALAPWLTPVFIAYFVFALMTWIAGPLFNLLLRLDRFGRYALSREEIAGANLLGLCLAAALLSLGWWCFVRHPAILNLALVWACLCIPVSAIYHCESGWPRTTMALAAGGMAVMALLIALPALTLLPVVGDSLTPLAKSVRALSRQSAEAYFLTVFISCWVGNALVAAHPKR